MNNITELVHQLKSAAQEEIMCRESSDTSDAWQDLASPENILLLVEIALPVLEQKTHESIIAEQLECVRDSLTLNLHQEAIINCAIDRLNELNKRIQDLSRSVLEPQPTTDTYRQIENDGWIEWRGGYCPVAYLSEVQVKYRDGCEMEDTAGDFSWTHDNEPDDIIAYRVIEVDGSGA
ncbi:hypothetical protein SOM41_22385 [Enterobacter sp. CFBP8995]|nr:hypothetical protein [Enterobacter sp. CFBP8995]